MILSKNHKIFLSVLINGLFLIFSDVYSQPPQGNWDLVFEDNFTGTSLDLSKWNYNYPSYFPNSGRTHNHRAYMDQAQVKVENGFLKISAINQRHPSAPDGTNQWESQFGFLSFDYTSGTVNTRTKFEFTYGYVEGRFKMPPTLGTWPAFWTLNSTGE